MKMLLPLSVLHNSFMAICRPAMHFLRVIMPLIAIYGNGAAVLATPATADSADSAAIPSSPVAALGAGLDKFRLQERRQNAPSQDSDSSHEIELNGRHLDIEFPLTPSFTISSSLTQLTPSIPSWTQANNFESRISYDPLAQGIKVVVGAHWEFSKYDLTRRDAPEYALTEVRAYLLGVSTYRKLLSGIWSSSFGIFGSYELMNATLRDDHGKQYTLGIFGNYNNFIEFSTGLYNSSYSKQVPLQSGATENWSIERKIKGFTAGARLWL